MANDQEKVIEMLLRRRALQRNSEGSSAGVPSERSSPHLDADELNAYAEGALPSVTRSRYSMHLADCDNCRRVVTQLALAAGSTRPSMPLETASAKWLGRLHAIFSARVLRYAIPVLVLLSITTVVIVTMRSRDDQPLIARNDRPDIQTIPPAAQEQPPVLSKESERTEAGRAETPADTPADTDRTPSIAQKAPTGEAIPTRPQTDAVPQPVRAAPAPVQQNTVRDDVESEYATKTAKAKKDESADRLSKEESARVAAAPASGSEVTPRRVEEPTAAAPPADFRVGAARARPKEQRQETLTKEQDTEETRSVSGRRFRRQGQAWIDTAYSSSMAVTNVRRSSEQYRSLVADEPGIRAIADQLDGEIIVVWKRRAYRIY